MTLQPVTVVLALPVADLERSLRFYRDGLGLATPGIDEDILAFELPNLSLFLIERSQYSTYLDRAGVAGLTAPAAGACVISCAIGTPDEVEDVLARAAAAGGASQKATEHDGSCAGYFSDPDGHLWELVNNHTTQAAQA